MKLRYIDKFDNSDQYREKIHRLIPGGCHTYSKGDDQFPLRSPAAIQRGEGVHVWDLDGNKYLDCSMGLTSVSLGHAYGPVLDRIAKTLKDGVNFQRPSYLEMEVAEKFLSHLPGQDMIKFAKNGSSVTTASVKLARAYTGRKYVAFPGDHPFYSYDDWFIGTTDCALGVPEEISQLSLKYQSDNLESLTELFEKNPGKIACVISEPEKWHGLPEGYLQDAINLAHKHGALYIVDEMITGYKTAFPGSTTKYEAKPDMITWGKGIANGFAFCALTGTRDVMKLGGIDEPGREKVFLISTTHGGETTALAAASATIDEFTSKDVIGHNHGIGRYFVDACNKTIRETNMESFVDLSDCDWMTIFNTKGKNGEADMVAKTVLLQEMIKRGVLFQGQFVPCFSHTREDVNYFAAAFHESLGVYKQGLEQGFSKLLAGGPIKRVFRKFI